MFGDPFQISYLDNFSNSLILLERSFILKFPMAYLAFLYFFDLALVLRSRSVTNPFPDPSNSTFDSEDVIFILFRLIDFNKMSKVTYSSLTLISLCFLTLWRPGVVTSTSPWKSHQSLTVWTRWKSHIQRSVGNCMKIVYPRWKQCCSEWKQCWRKENYV